jgi:hypothetical protein
MNILDKTIKSLRYFINIKEYDFIVRTNISTAFNYTSLYNYLNEMPRNNIYIGGYFFKLGWLQDLYGITKDNTEKYLLNGLDYFQGTCIILSCDVVKFILDNHHNLIHDVIDDVAIGLFIRTYLPDALKSTNLPKFNVIEWNQPFDINTVAYRHQSLNDDTDIKNMINTFKIIKEHYPI